MNSLLVQLANLDERRLKELSIGTFLYSGIFLTEGVGLALRKRWAEYFTIITTSSLLPLEVYELAGHPSMWKGLALLINLAVVAYLIFELRRYPAPHRWRTASEMPDCPGKPRNGMLLKHATGGCAS